MADRYLLESGAPDGYLLEDSSGVLLLEDSPAALPFSNEHVLNLAAPNRLRRGATTLQVVQSLLLSTLAAIAITDVPRAAVLYHVEPRAISQIEVPNLLVSTLGEASPAAAPFAPEDGVRVLRKRQTFDSVWPNLALSTLDFRPIPASAPESLEPQQRRRPVYDTSRGFNPALFPAAVVEPPFAPADFNFVGTSKRSYVAQALSAWQAPALPFEPLDFETASRRLQVYLDTSVGGIPSIVESPFEPAPFESISKRRAVQTDTSLAARDIPARAEPFFPQPDACSIYPRRALAQESASSPAVLLGSIVSPPFAAPPFEQAYPAVKRFPYAEPGQLPLVNRPITLLLPQPTFESVGRRKALPLLETPASRAVLDAVQAPFTPTHLESVRRLLSYPVDLFPVAAPRFPAVADPFKPLDVQRPQARKPVSFELPPNLQALFALVPATPPFAAQPALSPIEWVWTFNPTLPVVAYVEVVVPPAIAGLPNYARWILVEARDKTVSVPRRLHGILIEADGRENQS